MTAIIEHMELTLKHELQRHINELSETIERQRQEIASLKGESPLPSLAKNLPLPPVKHAKAIKYPEFITMEIGDSFFVAGPDAPSRMASARGHYQTGSGKHFTIRTLEENGQIGARVWRTR